MTTKQKDALHRVYGIVTGAVTVLAAVCLGVQCVQVYRGGSFSREAVAAAFAPIAVPVYACLVLVAGGLILDGLLPRERKKTFDKQPAFTLRRLLEGFDVTACDSETCQGLFRERESRRKCAILCGAVQAAAAVVFLIYALNGSHFHRTEINESMIRACYLFLPCLAVSFAAGVFSQYHSKRSMEREIALLKTAPKGEKAPKKPQKSLLVWKLGLLAVAAVLIAVGYAGGGFQDVLTKAVNICTECIGLG